MYQIKMNRKLGKLEFKKYTEQYRMQGSVDEITARALEEGIDETELARAFNYLVENTDDIAEFGINGTLIFTKKEGE
jgi:hypothetical protein